MLFQKIISSRRPIFFMSQKLVLFSFLFAFFLGSFAFATSVGQGSYSDVLQSGSFQGVVYKTSELSTTPTPTNDWWTSLLFDQFSREMYAFPLCHKADNDGLTIGTPNYVTAGTTHVTANFQAHLKMRAFLGTTKTNLISQDVRVSSFTDWSVTSRWTHNNNSAQSFEATIGQGFVFTYFKFFGDIKPEIVLPRDWGTGAFYIYNHDDNFTAHKGTDTAHPVYGNVRKIITDRIAIEAAMDCDGNAGTWEKNYYGVFLPAGTTVYFADYDGGQYGYHRIIFELPAGKNFISVGAMFKLADVNTWKDYAYNFITDTKVSWNVSSSNNDITSTYQVTTDNINTTTLNDGGDTLIALFPHQYRTNTIIFMTDQFTTLRGRMKILKGKSFQTKLPFYGIVPSFGDNGSYNKTTLQQYINDDKAGLNLSDSNLYYVGKNANRIVNLIMLCDKLGDTTNKAYFLDKLKTSLVDWFTSGSKTSNFFYYHSALNSLMAFPHNYGSEYLNDHNYHYGYVVYAAAILAFYDQAFRNDYKEFIELLIKDFACPSRNDAKFPFLRSFSPYEGHSFQNGLAVGLEGNPARIEGNDIESSSEAMNSWAAIYLWGLITGNDEYTKLGMWGYTTEYSAIQNYFYDIYNDIYPSQYDKTSIGILFGNKVIYDTWFTQSAADRPENVYGIQMLPINPMSLYLAYDQTFMQNNYESFYFQNGNKSADVWKDIFLQYQVMYDSQTAISNYNPVSISNYESASKAFLYYWLYSFEKLGKLKQDLVSDYPGYSIFLNQATGTTTYIVFNPSNQTKRIDFKNRSNNASRGFLIVPANSIYSANSFSSATDFTPPPKITNIYNGLNIGYDVRFSSNLVLAANWVASNDPDSGIMAYRYCVGTSQGGRDVCDWVEVPASTTSAVLNYQNIQTGKKYYFAVIAVNGAGLTSELAFSNSIIFDTTPPEAPLEVYDGEVFWVDQTTQKQNTYIAANWKPANDAESGIAKYWYAIGTSPGATDVKNWTSTSLTSFKENLTVLDNTTYYTSVKAENNVGLFSGVTTSNGISVDINKPQLIMLNDGISPKGDLDFTNSTDTLKAVWEYDSAIKYYFAVSSNSAAQIQDLTWNETTNYFMEKTGLTLLNATTYYTYVRAENSTGGVSNPARSNGIFVYYQKPTAKIYLNQQEPLPNGIFNVSLEIISGISTKKPNLYYRYENTTDYIKILLNGMDKVWYGDGFVDFNSNAKSIIFKIDVEDVAENIGSELSKSTFTINILLDFNKDVTLVSQDGTEVFIPKGTFKNKFSVSIEEKQPKDAPISYANAVIKNINSKNFADNNALYRKFALFDQDGTAIKNFDKEITIRLPYKDANGDRMIDGSNNVSVESLAIFYLNEFSNIWERLPVTEIDYFKKLLITKVSHFSIYGILLANNISDLSEFKIYPNPFYVKKHTNVKIDGLPNTSKNLDVYIYDITGKMLKRFYKKDLIMDYNGNYISWNGLSKKGDKLASGVYIVLVKTEDDTKKEKMALIW